MDKAYRTYSLIILALVALALVPVAVLSVVIGPPIGDLARTSLSVPRDFAWEEPQQELAADITFARKYQHYADVVVLGDSFSQHDPVRVGAWVDHFQALTGYSITVLHLDNGGIADLVASPGFSAFPPRLVVLESVERLMGSRLDGTAPCAVALPRALPPLVLAPRPLPARPVRWSEMMPPFHLLYTLRYYTHAVLFALRGQEPAGPRLAVRWPMTVSDKFSNRRPDQLLTVAQDEVKRSWTERTVAGFRCAIQDLAAQVEANGTTHFSFLPAPDKSTVYAPYVAAGSDLPPSRLAELEGDGHLPVAPSLAMLTHGAASGRDIYLPGDSHWGSAGQRLAAEAVLADLRRRGRLGGGER